MRQKRVRETRIFSDPGYCLWLKKACPAVVPNILRVFIYKFAKLEATFVILKRLESLHSLFLAKINSVFSTPLKHSQVVTLTFTESRSYNLCICVPFHMPERPQELRISSSSRT